MLTENNATARHKGFLRYFKNTSWMMAEQGLRLISGLFVGIWVARYLGPEQFGIFSYALAFTAIFAGIAKLGLDGIIVRELVNQPLRRDQLMATAFWLKIIGACMVMALMALILPFMSSDKITNIYISIIAAGLLFQSFEIVEFYFQSQVMAKFVSICKVVQLFISSLIKIALVIMQADLLWFVLVVLFDTIILALSYIAAYKYNKLKLPLLNFDMKVAKSLLHDCWPLIFASVVTMIYMRIDQVMIKQMLGDYEVGIYSAAVRLSEVVYFIPVIISASIFPAILNAKKVSSTLYVKRFRQLYAFMIWLAISIALATSLLGEFVVSMLYGSAYVEAAQVLIIHTWSAVFVFLGVAFSKYLLAENLTKIDFLRTLAGAVFNVLLNLWLIPLHGVVGAAIATLISQFIVNVAYDFFDKRLHKQLKIKIEAFFMPWKVFIN